MSDALSDRTVGHLTAMLATPDLPERYEAFEVIGEGGMGVVRRAHDRVLRRDVAVKILAPHCAGDEWAARLLQEARILAHLEHPGIVAVHDAGTLPDGRAWYAMRLIDGRRLDVAAATFVVGDVLRVMLRLAETLAFAHAHGVVHRDLTPRNVMIGPFGEVLVLDWGVARIAGEREHGIVAAPTDGVVTAHGRVVGTPGYMAPEQAAGLPADPRSDVHGLGAILRDLLAALPAPPRPLAAIRDRALAADPAARYPDATAFADDLRRFQDGLAVSAYREGRLEALRRWLHRYRTPVVLVVAYLAMRLLIFWWRGI